MREDLLHAQACVNWAESNIPSLERRLDIWARSNFHIVIEDGSPDCAENIVVLIEKSTLPLAFSVEVGAYINTIRCGLDLLATALAVRHNMPSNVKIYFPVATSLQQWLKKAYKGHEFVEILPEMDRKIIQDLQPCNGGDPLLGNLHSLDIHRKHSRLLSCVCRSASIGVVGWGLSDIYTPSPGFDRRGNKTILGKLAKGAPKPKFHHRPYVAFNEALIPQATPVSSGLYDFVTLASTIIHKFNRP